MIAYLTGVITSRTTNTVVVDVGGVGYEVVVPLSTFYSLPEAQREVGLHIYTHVREDAIVLFGFATEIEKRLFMMLISVSGIGPRLAVNILSGIGPHDFLSAVAGGDAVRLQAIPGVGKKTAERIALEIRDRAVKLQDAVTPESVPSPQIEDRHLLEDARSALVNLGYPAKQASAAIDKAALRVKQGNIESLITEALRILA
ncbi:MAG TPA: Holliday junction branch migration protein RuvA [Desulfobacteraceae bacterium]|jgi:holliday junction DNA helicase RuvA|nr:Holliday junction branch migration protein RuvA [Desulfobacteraceae bacterium]